MSAYTMAAGKLCSVHIGAWLHSIDGRRMYPAQVIEDILHTSGRTSKLVVLESGGKQLILDPKDTIRIEETR